MKPLILSIFLGILTLAALPARGQGIHPDPAPFVGDTSLPVDTSGVPLSDSSKYNMSNPSDTLPVLHPDQQPEEKEHFGTVTEIKTREQYNPKKTITALQKGNFGKPVDYAKDSVHWKRGAFLGLDINQGTLTNWAAGGDHFSLALGVKADLYANYSDNRNSWDNNLNMGLGFLQTSSQGIRKSDDKLELYSKYGYRFSKHWYYSVLVNVRTQFANGYNYPDDSTVISHFLAPGYALGSVGISYQPNDNFSIFMSPVTSRFVIVNDQRLANEGAFGAKEAVYDTTILGERYLVKPGKRINYELGAYLSIIYNKEIFKNINWKTRLELYSNYLDNPQNIDVHWNSLITFKVNKFISASVTTELIYDNDVKYITYVKNADGSIKQDPLTGEKIILDKSARIQFKELVGIGFAYTF